MARLGASWADATDDSTFLQGLHEGKTTGGILGEYHPCSVKILKDGSKVIVVELDSSSDEEDAPAEESGRRQSPFDAGAAPFSSVSLLSSSAPKPPCKWIGQSPLSVLLSSPLAPAVPLASSPSAPPHQPPRERFAWGLPSRRYATAGWRDLGGYGLPGSGKDQRENARKRAQKERKARLRVKTKAKP